MVSDRVSRQGRRPDGHGANHERQTVVETAKDLYLECIPIEGDQFHHWCAKLEPHRRRIRGSGRIGEFAQSLEERSDDVGEEDILKRDRARRRPTGRKSKVEKNEGSDVERMGGEKKKKGTRRSSEGGKKSGCGREGLRGDERAKGGGSPWEEMRGSRDAEDEDNYFRDQFESDSD